MSKIVSIIMPTFNRAKVISRSIQSIRQQSYKDWELIVVDDMSTDNTQEVINEIRKQDKRIHYIKNTHKKGPSGARNAGIEKSNGDYIAFLDSDDEWFPEHLEESLRAMNEMQANVCFSLWIERMRDGTETARFQLKEEQQQFWKHINDANAIVKVPFFKFNRSFFEYAITHKFFIYHINGLVLNKYVFNKIDTLDENLGASEDTDLIFRLLRHFSIAFINKPHFYYNQGDDNLYLFVNRKTLELSDILNNKMIIEKISYCCYEKCKMLCKRLKIIKKHNHLKEKKLCIDLCLSTLSNKYFTLAVINRELHRYQSIKYQMCSLFYCRNAENLKRLWAMFSDNAYKKLNITIKDINIT